MCYYFCRVMYKESIFNFLINFCSKLYATLKSFHNISFSLILMSFNSNNSYIYFLKVYMNGIGVGNRVKVYSNHSDIHMYEFWGLTQGYSTTTLRQNLPLLSQIHCITYPSHRFLKLVNIILFIINQRQGLILFLNFYRFHSKYISIDEIKHKKIPMEDVRKKICIFDGVNLFSPNLYFKKTRST